MGMFPGSDSFLQKPRRPMDGADANEWNAYINELAIWGKLKEQNENPENMALADMRKASGIGTVMRTPWYDPYAAFFSKFLKSKHGYAEPTMKGGKVTMTGGKFGV